VDVGMFFSSAQPAFSAGWLGLSSLLHQLGAANATQETRLTSCQLLRLTARYDSNQLPCLRPRDATMSLKPLICRARARAPGTDHGSWGGQQGKLKGTSRLSPGM